MLIDLKGAEDNMGNVFIVVILAYIGEFTVCYHGIRILGYLLIHEWIY